MFVLQQYIFRTSTTITYSVHLNLKKCVYFLRYRLLVFSQEMLLNRYYSTKQDMS